MTYGGGGGGHSEGLNRLHELSATRLCWCGQSHADVVQDTRTVSYTEVVRLDGHAAGRRWHYGHEPGWACNTRCTTVRPATVMQPVKPVASTPQLDPERACTMCRLGEYHPLFPGPMVSEGRTAGMCWRCADLWEQVQWPRATGWLDARHRRSDLRRLMLMMACGMAAVTLVAAEPDGPWPVWSLITILTMATWYHSIRLRDSRRAAVARRERRAGDRPR